MYRLLVIILLSLVYSLSNAQEASWFLGEWNGGPIKREKSVARQIQTTFIISSISGNNFEGTVKRILYSDTSIQLISKVSGYITHDFLVATLGESTSNNTKVKWDLTCSKCGAITFAFSMEDEKFVLTGVTKGCGQCNGVSIYSRNFEEFDPLVKASLDTLINNKKQTASLAVIPVPFEPNKLPIDTSTINAKNEISFEDSVIKAPTKPFQKISDSLTISRAIIVDTILKPVTIIPAKEDSLPIIQRTIIEGQVIQVSTPKAQNEKPSQKPLPSIKPQEIFEKREMNFSRVFIVNTDSVIIKLFDNGIVDGDIVSVFLNGIVIVNRLSLTGVAFEIKIPIDKTIENKIVVYAHNLGTISPNTSLLQIFSGKTMQSLTLSSDLETSGGIILKFNNKL